MFVIWFSLVTSVLFMYRDERAIQVELYFSNPEKFNNAIPCYKSQGATIISSSFSITFLLPRALASSNLAIFFSLGFLSADFFAFSYFLPIYRGFSIIYSSYSSKFSSLSRSYTRRRN